MIHTLTTGLITHRRWAIAILLISTAMMAWLAQGIQLDASVQPLYDTESEDYLNYQAFISRFGNEDILLVAVQCRDAANTPAILAGLARSQAALTDLDGVIGATALSDIIPSNTSSSAQSVPKWILNALPITDMAQLRRLLPDINRFISQDLQTAGIVISLSPGAALGDGLKALIRSIQDRVVTALPGSPRPVVVGMPVLRLAVKEYTLRTAVSFGGLALLIGTLIAFYMFRSIRVTLIATAVCLGSLTWVFGIMALFHIQVNTITSLCFGFVLVVASTSTMHVVTHFFEAHRHFSDRNTAVSTAFESVLRPCFFCALTTAVGFASFLLSPVNSIREAGLVISLGVVFTFLLAFPLAAAMLSMTRPPSAKKLETLTEDLTARLVNRLEAMGLRQSGWAIGTGVVFLALMTIGIPKITTDTYLLNALHADSPERQDMVTVDRQLGLPDSMSVLISTSRERWADTAYWRRLADMESQMAALPEVTRIESPFAFLSLIQGFGGSIGEIAAQLPTQPNNPMRGYLDPSLNTVRLSVNVDYDDPPNLVNLASQLKQIADHAVGEDASVRITGQLGLAATQSVRLVSAQGRSLVFALTVITILMVVQLGSFTMGLLSLIPNLFPLMTIFGCMGWLGIKLDPITIFSAVVSFGLSVDDTIHYLTHLKDSLGSAREDEDLSICLQNAFRKTSRALFSTTMVLACSCIALVYSPFHHISSLGLLIAAAAVSAYWADVVFMPALILRFGPLRRLVCRRRTNTCRQG